MDCAVLMDVQTPVLMDPSLLLLHLPHPHQQLLITPLLHLQSNQLKQNLSHSQKKWDTVIQPQKCP